jgi:hypothetical protein
MSQQTAVDAQGKSLKDRVGKAAALVAAAGAVWYAAISALSAWVYEPVHVSPRDLGLSSSAIFVQATVGLVVSVLIGVVAGGVLGGIWGARQAGRDPEVQAAVNQTPLPFRSDDPVSNAAAAAWLRQEAGLSQERAEQFVRDLHDATTTQDAKHLRAIAPPDVPDNMLNEIVGAIHREVPRAQLRAQALQIFAVMGAILGIVMAVLLSLIVVIGVAWSSRDDIQVGRAPAFILGLPPPWSATIADVTPAPGSALGATNALPQCALFLGQNDSTVFLRKGSGPTIRLPASTVRLDLRARHRC